jgi:ubiquinone/menaquinone biosynthesis C-methylase UbiE/DNA-binding HxlR family transcriptional regulator
MSERTALTPEIGLTTTTDGDSGPALTSDVVRLQPGSVLDLFRALGDSTRLRILASLLEMELAVGEIAQLLDQSQPRVSRHIRLLEEVGLVERRREGSWVFVRLATDGPGKQALAVVQSLSANACEEAALAADRARLSAITAERDAAARRYFDAHANEWDAMRSLHVAENAVEQAILRLLDGRALGHLLDIGTGTGRMVELLGPAATHVTALDRSPEMLRLARSRLARSPIPVDLVHGDFARLPITDESIGTVVLHQVLHYARAPEAVIAEIARVLSPGGIVLFVDFAPHDREELRRDAAHARLGFSDSQVREWCTAAGITIEMVETLAGSPLTVKLWLGRRRRARAPAQSLPVHIQDRPS